jgi:pimeloyl-ACP methyl ester carboxylesterase
MRRGGGHDDWRARLGAIALVVVIAGCIPFAAEGAEAGRRPAAVPRFEPASCPVDFPSDARVDCGYLVVRENRALAAGRTIRLAVAVLRTGAANPRPDPILFLQGGPSFPAIDPFGFSLAYFGGAGFASDRDVILLDERGVGSSRPLLNCPEFDRLVRDTFPRAPTLEQNWRANRDCRDRLARKADLSAYNAGEAAADVADLRATLGIQSWNIVALSAGTWVAQATMRLHPDGIRTVTLDSPASAFALDPGLSSIARDRSLRLVFRGCASDEVCARRHPDLEPRFWAFVHRLRRHPQRVRVGLTGGGTFSFLVDGDTFLDDITGCAGSPECAVEIPDTIDRAIADGVQSLHEGETWGPPEPLSAFLAEGKTDAMNCHDRLAFLTQAHLREEARWLPEYRHFILHPWFEGLCDVWDVGTADANAYSYVHSRIPTVLLEGFDDGPTGSSLPETLRIAHRLPRSFTFALPGLGHIELFNPCARHIATHFMNHPGVRPAGTCLRSMQEPDFSPQARRVALGERSPVLIGDLRRAENVTRTR